MNPRKFLFSFCLLLIFSACHVTKQEILDERKREEGRQQEREKYENQRPKNTNDNLLDFVYYKITPIPDRYGSYSIDLTWSMEDNYSITIVDHDAKIFLESDFKGPRYTSIPCKSGANRVININLNFVDKLVTSRKFEIECPIDIVVPDNTKSSISLDLKELTHRIGRISLGKNAALVFPESLNNFTVQSIQFGHNARMILVNSFKDTKPLRINVGEIIGTPHFESYGRHGQKGMSGLDLMKRASPNHPYFSAMDRIRNGTWIGAPGTNAFSERQCDMIPRQEHTQNKANPNNESIAFVFQRDCKDVCRQNAGPGGQGPDGITGLRGAPGNPGVDARSIEMAVAIAPTQFVHFVTAPSNGGAPGDDAPDISPGAGGHPGAGASGCHNSHPGPPGNPAPTSVTAQKQQPAGARGKPAKITSMRDPHFNTTVQELPSHNFNFKL